MKPLNIFYSYSHKDENHLEELKKFLITLKKDFKIDDWYDRKILVWDNWSEEIQEKMNISDIMIMLVSQNYISSSACNYELKFALEQKNKKRIIPIILSPCTWKDTEFSKIQSLPIDWKPITTWSNQESAWLNVFEGINKVVSREKNKLSPKQDYLEWLEKIDFVSSSKEKVNLSEIFVYPTFNYRWIDESEETNIEGKCDLFLDPLANLSIIKGPSLSWKSSIWKKIFIDSISWEYYPLFLDADLIYKNSDFNNVVKKEFLNQYNWEYKDYNEKNDKILIIDNYSHKISKNFIKWSKENFKKIIIIIEDDEFETYFREDEVYVEFSIYTIKPLSAKKQLDLLTNWKKIDFQLSSNPDAFHRYIDNIENKISDIITKNQIIPSYPFYILSIIQAFEWFMPLDYQITAYWHCYNALITSQLIKKGIEWTDIGDCYNFLSNLAYEIFISWKWESWTLKIEEYEKFKIDYREKFNIKKNLISLIENDDYLIINKNTHVRFEQSYIYYYFVGEYIAKNNLDKHISELCSLIYKKEFSNILIFTIHHTTNQKLLEEIQLHCMVSFDSMALAKLTTEETQFMNRLMLELPTSILNEKSIEENKSDEREEIDEDKKEDNDENLEKNEEFLELIEIKKSFKIIEVLGQILKNRAGSFEKKKVSELLFEVESLWLRLLNFFLEAIKSQDFYNFIEKRLKVFEERNEKKYFSWEERRKFIEANIQIMAMTSIMNMLEKIFNSVSTDKLLETQKLITKRNSFPSLEFLNLLFQLYHNWLNANEIIKLNENFKKEKNIWAIKTLSYILQMYLNTHMIDYKDRQRIYSEVLKMKYIPNKNELNW